MTDIWLWYLSTRSHPISLLIWTTGPRGLLLTRSSSIINLGSSILIRQFFSIISEELNWDITIYLCLKCWRRIAKTIIASHASFGSVITCQIYNVISCKIYIYALVWCIIGSKISTRLLLVVLEYSCFTAQESKPYGYVKGRPTHSLRILKTTNSK